MSRQARPSDKKELQKREAIGIIRASRFVRKYAHSRKEINVETIKKIHKEIFNDAWHEIAGEYRKEDLRISDSKHLPPHFSKVPNLMSDVDSELQKKLGKLGIADGILHDGDQSVEKMLKTIESVVTVAAWVHHKITYIHPFREGNGRTARLTANLVLERFGLMGISVKVEKENKNRYRKALSQIDAAGDYEPLKDLIYEGLEERFDGVAVKYYNIRDDNKK